MNQDRRAALEWAIKIARMKATVAAQASRKSSTSFGAQTMQRDANKFTLYANELDALLRGEQ